MNYFDVPFYEKIFIRLIDDVGRIYNYKELIPEREAAFELIDPYEGLPEWEKRRRQSADAKAELIRKMKGKRK